MCTAVWRKSARTLRALFRKHIPRRNDTRRVFVSFLSLTLALLTLAAATTLRYSREALAQEIQRSRETLLRQYSNNIEQSYLSRMGTILNEKIVTPYGASALLNFWKSVGVADTLAYYTEMRTLLLNHPYLESAFAYRLNDDVGLSTGRGLTMGLTRLGTKNVSAWEANLASAWKENPSGNRWIAPLENSRQYAASSITLITRVIPIPLFGSQKQGFFALTLKAEVLFSDIIANEEDSQTAWMLLDQDGRLFAHSNRDMLMNDLSQMPPLSDVLGGADGFTVANENGAMFAYVSGTIPSTGWRLVSRTPLHEMIRRASLLNRAVWLVILVYGAVAAVVARVIARRIMRPWGVLSADIRTKLNVAPEVGDVESMRRMVDESDGLREAVERARSGMPLTIMAEMLYRRSLDEDTFFRAARMLDKELSGGPWRLLICPLDEDARKRLDVVESKLLVSRIETALSESFGKSALAVAISHNLIVSLLCENVAQYSDADYIAVRDRLCRQTGACFNFLISRPLAQYQDIGAAFAVFEPQKRYSYLYGYGNVWTASQIDIWEGSGARLSAEDLEAFRRAIDRDPASARAMLARMTEELLLSGCSYNTAQTAMVELTQAVSRKIQTSNLHSRDFGPQLMEQFTRIASMTETVGWIDRVIEVYQQIAESQTRSIDRAFLERIARYIEEHIEEDVSLDSVARVFGVSIGHLSHVFKETLDINFSDYAIDRKMERAAEKLAATRDTIASIMSSVGYRTPAYFSKIFKGKYGITPSEYRRVHYGSQ
jgi:AraC-like DNA-binding protein